MLCLRSLPAPSSNQHSQWHWNWFISPEVNKQGSIQLPQDRVLSSTVRCSVVFIPHSHRAGRSDTAMKGELHPFGPTAGGHAGQTSLFRRMNGALYVFITACPCIINDFHKTINSISGEVTRERTKTEYKLTLELLWMPIWTCQRLKGFNTLRYKYHQTQIRGLCMNPTKPWVGIMLKTGHHIQTIWSRRTLPLPHMAALILSFSKGNTLTHFLTISKQCQHPF